MPPKQKKSAKKRKRGKRAERGEVEERSGKEMVGGGEKSVERTGREESHESEGGGV